MKGTFDIQSNTFSRFSSMRELSLMAGFGVEEKGGIGGIEGKNAWIVHTFNEFNDPLDRIASPFYGFAKPIPDIPYISVHRILVYHR